MLVTHYNRCVACRNHPIRAHYADFEWVEDAEILRAWQKGRTGYPLVDAGMRELWETGWMHQNVRMVVAVFLTEICSISWVEGERHAPPACYDILWYHPLVGMAFRTVHRAWYMLIYSMWCFAVPVLTPIRFGPRWFHDTLVDADLAINSMMWQNAGKTGTGSLWIPLDFRVSCHAAMAILAFPHCGYTVPSPLLCFLRRSGPMEFHYESSWLYTRSYRCLCAPVVPRTKGAPE